ncbi:ClpP/crotonase-like domain-containing protein [Russula earlei]|uniref:ClpP/crotonase-like domain-containing protein n=1 Tax=Russula earlei TaxID=71964 RepID=A0ACC0U2V7_9AGAM|nr:ClpP/crotonase-like domain-containing protein [Russula earlei]
MIKALAYQIEQWENAELCGVIVGTGAGKAFCAGGDVSSVIELSTSDATRPEAVDFFRREYGLDYFLANLSKPYVAIMDWDNLYVSSFGGGFGLVAPAPFRVATENCLISMPETKIGLFPDVGASYYLSRLDGQLGTYLALTGTPLAGRAAFEHGLATHYIPSARVPMLLESLAALEKPTYAQVNEAIEDLYHDKEPTDPIPPLSGPIRIALDTAFSQDTVEDIVATLNTFTTGDQGSDQRSPTSLKLALVTIRKGKLLDLLECFKMELGIATAFCVRSLADSPVYDQLTAPLA